MSTPTSKLSKAAYLFENQPDSSLPSTSFGFLRLNLSIYNFLVVFLLPVSPSVLPPPGRQIGQVQLKTVFYPRRYGKPDSLSFGFKLSK
jgi:hypothetical protein